MKRFLLLLLLSALALLLLAACGGKDRPPDDGSPWPENLSGVFVCGDSSLSFNGDGVSVRLKLSGELAEKTGLPEGENEGSYAFLFHNESWRYDLAEGLRITVGEVSLRFLTVPGSTNGRQVCFTLNDGTELKFTKD